MGHWAGRASGLSCSLIALASVCTSASADDVALDVKRHVLDNGMTILVVERHTAPVFSAYIHYRVGSANEWPGMIGAAHLLEHMLFKGTTTLGTKDYAREAPLLAREDSLRAQITREENRSRMLNFQRSLGLADVEDNAPRIAQLTAELEAVKTALADLVEKNEYEELYNRNGATSFNAGTGYDGTTYYVALPSNRLPLFFEVEGDRMANPILREFYAERDVVIEERRLKVDNEGDAKLFEQLIGTAFIAHPYQIFWEWKSEVAQLTRPKLVDFFKRYYAPNRMVLAIVGDVSAEDVFALADHHFGPTPRQPDPDPIATVEPVQEGERRVCQEFDAEPYLSVGYHKTAFDDPDEIVFRVIHRVLSDGRTSRLYKSLVLDQQIAVHVSTYDFPGSESGDLYPNLLGIDVVPKAPHTTADAEQALYAELDRLGREPISGDELQKVKNRIEADFVWSLYSNLGLASNLAEYEARAGNWQYLLTVRDQLAKVSQNDIMRVASIAFRPQNRTVATLVPMEPEG
jgi:predicted Zn-dependent peptidase